MTTTPKDPQPTLGLLILHFNVDTLLWKYHSNRVFRDSDRYQTFE